MNLAVVHSRGSDGIEAPPVQVEVHLGPGLPALLLVGTSSTVGLQARERVRAALITSQWAIPTRKITISLSPAEQPKDGGRFDLAIAVGILAANGDLPLPALRDIELLGELSLTAALNPTRGILPAVMAAVAAGRACIVPAADAQVLTDVAGAIHCARTLTEATDFLRGRRRLPSPAEIADDFAQPTPLPRADLTDVAGQEDAKLALEIAAAGAHHLLMVGPPGCGKTMLAERMAGILPPMDAEASMQARVLASVAGASIQPPGQPPFRAVHHSTSASALLGGGSTVYPGEISLAHRGVLFMDEFAQWPGEVLDQLRQPLQDGHITLKRGKRSVTYPSTFQLIAASNLCRCGRTGTVRDDCICRPDERDRYLRKISGPLIDRMDLQVRLVALTAAETQDSMQRVGETSEIIRARVLQARERQMDRNGGPNAHMSLQQMQRHCRLKRALQMLFNRECDQRGLSVRGMHRTLRVSRTIADLRQSDEIGKDDLMTALRFSPGPIRVSQSER